MRAGWSVALFFVLMGGLGVRRIGSQESPSTVGWALAGYLVASGAALLLRHKLTFWNAMMAATLLAVSGALALAGKRELSLPMPPWLTLVVGLYMCLRLIMAKEQ